MGRSRRYAGLACLRQLRCPTNQRSERLLTVLPEVFAALFGQAAIPR